MIIKTTEALSELRGCSVVEGQLIIALGVLQEKSPPAGTDLDSLNITFPELTEVTDYVLITMSKTLHRLNTLFPNLAVIRGNKLMEVSCSYNLNMFHVLNCFSFPAGLCFSHL